MSAARSSITSPGHATAAMVSEVEDDLDVVGLLLERLLEVLERQAAGDHALEPGAVGARERLGSQRVVAQVGVDRPEYHVVLEHYVAVEVAEVERERPPARRYAGQADDAVGGVVGDRLGDHRLGPRRL